MDATISFNVSFFHLTQCKTVSVRMSQLPRWLYVMHVPLLPPPHPTICNHHYLTLLSCITKRIKVYLPNFDVLFLSLIWIPNYLKLKYLHQQWKFIKKWNQLLKKKNKCTCYSIFFHTKIRLFCKGIAVDCFLQNRYHSWFSKISLRLFSTFKQVYLDLTLKNNS